YSCSQALGQTRHLQLALEISVQQHIDQGQQPYKEQDTAAELEQLSYQAAKPAPGTSLDGWVLVKNNVPIACRAGKALFLAGGGYAKPGHHDCRNQDEGTPRQAVAGGKVIDLDQ